MKKVDKVAVIFFKAYKTLVTKKIDVKKMKKGFLVEQCLNANLNAKKMSMK